MLCKCPKRFQVLFEPEPESPKIEFYIVGIITSAEFQLCRTYAESLYKSFPKRYSKPILQPLLNVDWSKFKTKMRREIGGAKMWSSERDVMIFMDGKYFGDDQTLIQFVATRYKFSIIKDYEQVGDNALMEYIAQEKQYGANFVYLSISIDDIIIGSLLFKLYSETVPTISRLFRKRCSKKGGGYTGKLIERIAIPSLIQCSRCDGCAECRGFIGCCQHLQHYEIPCENYIIPHNRRGVLSMCHNGKHTDNSTQFFITLGSAPWMDYKYVAFGQLLHGEDVLKAIENVPTYYEAPLKTIQIVGSGDFTVCSKIDHGDITDLKKFLIKKHKRTGLHDDVIDSRDSKSQTNLKVEMKNK